MYGSAVDLSRDGLKIPAQCSSSGFVCHPLPSLFASGHLEHRVPLHCIGLTALGLSKQTVLEPSTGRARNRQFLGFSNSHE